MMEQSRDVTINIRSEQRENGKRLVRIDQNTEGKLFADGSGWTVQYREPSDPSSGDAFTILRVDPDRSVSISRSGDSQVSMFFTEGRQHISRMSTPAGILDVAFLTNRVSAKIHDNGGSVRIRYIVHCADRQPIDTRMSFTVSPE